MWQLLQGKKPKSLAVALRVEGGGLRSNYTSRQSGPHGAEAASRVQEKGGAVCVCVTVPGTVIALVGLTRSPRVLGPDLLLLWRVVVISF